MDILLEPTQLFTCEYFRRLCTDDTPGGLEIITRLMEKVYEHSAWRDVNYKVYFLHVLCTSDTRIQLLKKYFPLPLNIHLYTWRYKRHVYGKCSHPQCYREYWKNGWDPSAFCLREMRESQTTAIHTVSMWGSSGIMEYIIRNSYTNDGILIQKDTRCRTPLLYCTLNIQKTVITTIPLLIDEIHNRKIDFLTETYSFYPNSMRGHKPMTELHQLMYLAKNNQFSFGENLKSLIIRILEHFTREQWYEFDNLSQGPLLIWDEMIVKMDLFETVTTIMTMADYRIDIQTHSTDFSRFLLYMWHNNYFQAIFPYFGDELVYFKHTIQEETVGDTILHLIFSSHNINDEKRWDSVKLFLDNIPDSVFLEHNRYGNTFLHGWVPHLSFEELGLKDHTFSRIVPYVCDRLGKTFF